MHYTYASLAQSGQGWQFYSRNNCSIILYETHEQCLQYCVLKTIIQEKNKKCHNLIP